MVEDKMKPIPLDLIKSKFKLVDGELWSINADGSVEVTYTYQSAKYRVIYMDGETRLVHRVVWALHTNKEIFGQLDHRDGNTSNNNVSNLREVTNRENAQNWKRHRDGRKVGASLTKTGVWQVQMMLNKKLVYIGQFQTEEQAAEIYQKAIELEDQFHEIKSFRKLVKSSVSFDAFCVVANPNSKKKFDPKRNLDFDSQRNRWRVQMQLGGKKVLMGRFLDKQEASLFRDLSQQYKDLYETPTQFRQLIRDKVADTLEAVV